MSVIRHHLSALHVFAVEPGNSLAQEAVHCGLQLVRQNLHVVSSCGIVDRNVQTLLFDAGRAPLLTVAGDAVTDLAKAGSFCRRYGSALRDVRS